VGEVVEKSKQVKAGDALIAPPLVLEQVLYALSDANRLAIVRLIHSSGDELPCGSFSEVLKIGKPTISHHFGILRESGIISTRTEGTQKFNRIRRKELNARFPGLLDAILKAESVITTK
jgi:DNA-binding transcriptional ArsR family regulator